MNNVETVFSLEHIHWTKLEVIEFFSNLWMESEKAGFGFGWDVKNIEAKYAKGFYSES